MTQKENGEKGVAVEQGERTWQTDKVNNTENPLSPVIIKMWSVF